MTDRDQAPPRGRLSEPRYADALANANWDVVEGLRGFAAARGITMLDVAIGGLAAQPAVASVIAGATSSEQVHANARAGLWEPAAHDLVEIDAITSSGRR